MGRDKRNERHGEHFAKMMRKTMQTPAWRALGPTAQALYAWLKLEWRGPSANNNGAIRLSVRQAAECMGVGTDTAARAFHGLQSKGFIVVTQAARLGLEGVAKSPTYEITEIEMPNSTKNGGRKLYLEWRLGGDFPVHKAKANNPSGWNGKTNPRHRNRDRNVIKIETNR